ncbi:MAG: hypothetical protein ACXWWO_00620 [Candidatus Limnocylindria bacterium]
MIGTRAIASAAGSILVLASLGARGPDPAASRQAEELVRGRAQVALDALDRLASALEPALEAAREGSALAVQGDEAPGPRLEAAAEAVEGAATPADHAQRATAALDGALRARDPEATTLRSVVQTDALAAVAAERRPAATDADAVAEMRRRSSTALEAIDRSLATMVDGRYEAARVELAAARVAHDALVGAGGSSDALPVWLAATGAMITLVTTLIDATETDDTEAAAAASAEFAALAEDAAMADRALQIAISEGADSATRPAVARLAGALTAIGELRATIEAVSAP